MKRVLKALALPAALLAVWWVFLGTLIVTTANEAAVSEVQLARCDFVASGTAAADPTVPTVNGLTQVVATLTGVAVSRDAEPGPPEESVLPAEVTFVWPADRGLPSGPVLLPVRFRDDGTLEPVPVAMISEQGPLERVLLYADDNATRDRCRTIFRSTAGAPQGRSRERSVPRGRSAGD